MLTPTSVRQFAVCVWLLGGLFATAVRAGDDAAKLEFFETKIRPVLAKHCYKCHSAEAKELDGGLRVDNGAALRAGGESGPAIVPGKPDGSTLISALKYESFEMPPDGRLPESVIRDFEQWIRDGALDPREGDAPARKTGHVIDIAEGRKHWAFTPIKRPAVPENDGLDWAANEIDRFIEAKWKKEGLQPSADATRRELVRRIYFDLTGLPPTPGQVRAFLDDPSPTAVESLVDRLLESPQFGVTWGRHWLDVARYADSNGGDFNATFHDAWRYRNYVVDAYNADKSFTEFVREQLAGDLLPAADDAERTENLVATGFLMIGTKMLSERDKDKLTMDVVDEQISAVGSAFLGMTLGCVRCHGHKFDPILQEDYYALAGIFQSCVTLKGESQQYVSTWEPTALPASAERVAEVEQHERAVKKLKRDLDDAKKGLKAIDAELAKLKEGGLEITLDDEDAKFVGNWKASTYSPNYIGKGYVHDDQKGKGEKSAEFSTTLKRAALYDVRLSYASGSTRAAAVPITVETSGGTHEFSLDQRPKPPIDGLFAAVGRVACEAGEEIEITISNRGTEGYVMVDAVRLVPVDETGQPIRDEKAVDTAALKRAEEKQKQLQVESKTLEEQLKEREAGAPEPLPRAFAIGEGPEIADSAVRIRGVHSNLGPVVKRGFLQVASRPDVAVEIGTDESGRRELAEWIAAEENPLTARVYVNRVWSHLLGEGIVRTVDNFGLQGAKPTHPELLDWLAARFIAEGWSTKRLIREIMLSRVYRLSSQSADGADAADSSNAFLSHAHRRYITAESQRDALLSISGQLDLEPGESPVSGLGVLVTVNNPNAKAYERKESSKRSLYLPIIRNEVPPILKLFDFADPDRSVGKRSITNVPAQALLMMNSPFVMECAEKTAAKLLADGDEELVDRAYELVLSREPTEAERQRADAFFQLEIEETADDSGRKRRLARLVHVLFAATEFRLLD